MMGFLATFKILAALAIMVFVMLKFKSLRQLSVSALFLVLVLIFGLSLLAITVIVWILGWFFTIAIIVIAVIVVFKAHGVITRKTEQWFRSEKKKD